MGRTMNVTSEKDARAKIPDIEVVGNTDAWQLLVKASSRKEGWSHATKLLDVPNGVLVLVDTIQGAAISKAMTFVPGVTSDQIFDLNR